MQLFHFTAPLDPFPLKNHLIGCFLVCDLHGHLFTLVASLEHDIFGVEPWRWRCRLWNQRLPRNDNAKVDEILHVFFEPTCSKQQKLHNQLGIFHELIKGENHDVGFLIKGNSNSFCSTQQKGEGDRRGAFFQKNLCYI